MLPISWLLANFPYSISTEDSGKMGQYETGRTYTVLDEASAIAGENWKFQACTHSHDKSTEYGQQQMPVPRFSKQKCNMEFAMSPSSSKANTV